MPDTTDSQDPETVAARVDADVIIEVTMRYCTIGGEETRVFFVSDETVQNRSKIVWLPRPGIDARVVGISRVIAVDDGVPSYPPFDFLNVKYGDGYVYADIRGDSEASSPYYLHVYDLKEDTISIARTVCPPTGHRVMAAGESPPNPPPKVIID